MVATVQNDPAEMLEVFDARGRPTGRGKSRAQVHLDGDWHQAFHCWIVRPGSRGQEVVLQRRALTKDTFPGCWDAAAAGHWRMGETPEEAAREVAEELGLDVPFDRFVRVGRERKSRVHANGLVDREFHRVYRLEWSAPLITYRPDPVEVSALAAVPAAELIALASGHVDLVDLIECLEVLPDGSLRPAQITVTRETFVPYSASRLRRLLRP